MRIGLKSVLKNPSFSVVGYLTKALHLERIPRQAIMSVTEFVERTKPLAAIKAGRISDRQIKELILFGAFGDPEKTMKEFYALSLPKEDLPEYDYEKELANRLCEIRSVNTAEIELQLGRDIVPFELFLSPQYFGQQIAVVGQLVEPPHVHVTKQHKEMAFVKLVPLDVDPSYIEPRIEVVVWPDGYSNLRDLDPQPEQGDVLVVVGERAYNEKRHEPQITVGKDDEIFVFTD